VTSADDEEQTEFLNVDLEVFSRDSLAPFVKGLGRSVHVLHEGRWGRRYGACLELWHSGSGERADVIIRRMVRLLDKMPRPAKRLWNTAAVKQFNIGIQAAFKPRTFELPLSQHTLQAVARLGASFLITVYAAEVPHARSGKSSRERAGRPTRA